MKRIDPWFERAAKSEDKLVSFFQCVVTGSMGRYFLYRLRNVVILDTLMFVARAAEFLLVYRLLGHVDAFIVLALRVGSLLVDGAWWGFLEVMRERLRDLTEEGRSQERDQEVGNWIALTGLVAATFLCAAILFIVIEILPLEGGAIVAIYSFFIFLQTVAKLPVTTIHSGMYATRRIFRPSWSIFAPLVIQIAILAIGYAILPTAALLLSILAASVASIVLGLRYTLRVYELSGRTLGSVLKPVGFSTFLKGLPAGRAALSLLAGLCLQLDAIFVLILLGSVSGSAREIDFTAADPAWHIINAFAFFYLLLPALTGSYSWARVFYFDFVRLRRTEEYHALRRSFFKRVIITAMMIATWFWLLGFSLGVLQMIDFSFTLQLALLPLFLLRSLIGVYQFRMFADERLLSVVGSVGLFALGLWLVWLDPQPASDLLEVTAVMIVVLVALINLHHFRNRRQVLPVQLDLAAWFETLRAVERPVFVGELRFAPHIPEIQRRQVISAVRARLSGHGHYAFRNQDSLLFFHRDVVKAQDLDIDLSVMSGGATAATRHGDPVFSDGVSAATVLLSRWPDMQQQVARRPIDEQKSLFTAMFENGGFVDLATGEGSVGMKRLDPGITRLALTTGLKSYRYGKHAAMIRDHVLVPVLCQGALRLLLVLPPEAGRDALKRWRQSLAQRASATVAEQKQTVSADG
ncbi:hypothetical protein K1W69_21760 [Hoeflea sp. WL0058]|uniref:Uncharacterized protein n=1 Tax=Flavimaribacter sediminis TaxID=2865987 RepID=A0AAE2ZPF9_9HYPH|nr:hypothetical protein [Flavimaribacter sediminis]MBW8639836.1 hypothetical protein [Flavimaribacter sediminis]